VIVRVDGPDGALIEQFAAGDRHPGLNDRDGGVDRSAQIGKVPSLPTNRRVRS